MFQQQESPSQEAFKMQIKAGSILSITKLKSTVFFFYQNEIHFSHNKITTIIKQVK